MLIFGLTFFGLAVSAFAQKGARFGPMVDIEKFFELLDEEDPGFFDKIDEAYAGDDDFDIIPEDYGYLKQLLE